MWRLPRHMNPYFVGPPRSVRTTQPCTDILLSMVTQTLLSAIHTTNIPMMHQTIQLRRAVLIALCILIMFLVPSCSFGRQWLLIVPDNYTGSLFIAYTCPHGVSALDRKGNIRIEFQDDGVACVIEAQGDIYPVGSLRQFVAQTKGGQSVPVAVSFDTRIKGYAVAGSAGFVHNQVKPYPLEVITEYFWLGDMDILHASLQDGTYATQFNARFEQAVLPHYNRTP
jgi:hypothetical protein